MAKINLLPSTLKKLKRLKPAPHWTETFWCRCCKKEMSWECGASDEYPDFCDSCANTLASKTTGGV